MSIVSCKTCLTTCRCKRVVGCSYISTLAFVTDMSGSESSDVQSVPLTLNADGTFSLSMSVPESSHVKLVRGNLSCYNGKVIGVGYDVQSGSSPSPDYYRVVFELCPGNLLFKMRCSLMPALSFEIEDGESPLDTQPCLRDPASLDIVDYFDFEATMQKVCNIKSIVLADFAREPFVV